MIQKLKQRPIVRKITAPVSEKELHDPQFLTTLKLVWLTVSSLFSEQTGQLVGSAFVLLMLWGFHGNLELLGAIVPGWRGPGVDIGARPQLIPGIPWDQELISFLAGLLLVVIIPILIIRFGFKQPLSDYGLALPPKNRRFLAVQSFLILTLLCLPAFWVGAHDPSMIAVYPFYLTFADAGQFVLYELSYVPFFIAIEFIFRGYLLFGLAGVRDADIAKGPHGVPGALFFGKYALLLQMLSYTAWHLGKPLPELWGTLLWGLAAGVIAYTVRSIWPVVMSHWLLNVFLDFVVWRGL